MIIVIIVIIGEYLSLQGACVPMHDLGVHSQTTTGPPEGHSA
jgi:hypothetical protein